VVFSRLVCQPRIATLVLSAGAAEVARGLLPALPVFIELSSAEEPGPAALAAQAAAGVARLSPHDAAGVLHSALNTQNAMLSAKVTSFDIHSCSIALL